MKACESLRLVCGVADGGRGEEEDEGRREREQVSSRMRRGKSREEEDGVRNRSGVDDGKRTECPSVVLFFSRAPAEFEI